MINFLLILYRNLINLRFLLQLFIADYCPIFFLQTPTKGLDESQYLVLENWPLGHFLPRHWRIWTEGAGTGLKRIYSYCAKFWFLNVVHFITCTKYCEIFLQPNFANVFFISWKYEKFCGLSGYSTPWDTACYIIPGHNQSNKCSWCNSTCHI
jgi:hypothetical protein